MKKADLIKFLQEEETKDEILYEPEVMDSDISNLKLDRENLSVYVIRYFYQPKDNNIEDIVKLLYPKLLLIASTHKNYKISLEVLAYFKSSNFSKNESFRLYTKRYVKTEQNKMERMIKKLGAEVDQKDAEQSGWRLSLLIKFI